VVHQVDPEQEVLVVVNEDTSRKITFISSRDCCRTPKLKSESIPLILHTLQKQSSHEMLFDDVFIVRFTINGQTSSE
jgi:hypothetical protein